MNKKIIISLGIIGLAAAIAIGATTAFFSDTETSTGNIITAGAIDLKIDNESYITNEEGVLVSSPNTSWELNDLTNQLFFNFTDLKPGDIGEDTISLHVDNNDAWACSKITLTQNKENGMTEPEAKVDNTWGEFGGELAQNLYLLWWPDDGDNVLEEDEAAIIPSNFREGGEMSGALVGVSLLQLSESGSMTLSDSQYNFFTGAYDAQGGIPSLEGETNYYVGKAWCYGGMTITPLAQDSDTGPLDRISIICDGAQVGNESQTDKVMGDIEFYAVQSRNNENFTCASLNLQPEIIEVISSTMNFSSTGWAGWSCPAGHPNIVGGDTNCSSFLTHSLPWQSGSSVNGISYPNTPFGYNYSDPNEEGWIVQNGGTPQSCEIILQCQAN